MQTIENNIENIAKKTLKILFIFRFFDYNWFIASECFIHILQEKMTRF